MPVHPRNHHHENPDKREYSQCHRRRRHHGERSVQHLEQAADPQRRGQKRYRSEAGSLDVPVKAQRQDAPVELDERSESDGNFSRSSSEASEGALQAELRPTVVVVPQDTGKKYERRARHKTRPDKYVLKTGKKTVHDPAQEKNIKKSKRRRRKNNGLSLNHDFKAPNVPQDRLTLKPNTGPGIFHKGKASAPVERRGLPDLTFSEMTSLTKRREPHAGPQKQLKAPPKKKSNRGTAQEISGFFSGPEKKKADSHEPSNVMLGHPGSLASSRVSRSNSSPAKLGPRRSLSVMSGNESVRRAQSNLSIGVGNLRQAWVQDHDVPSLKHLKHLREIPELDRSPADASTSYYSWSASPSRRGPINLTPRPPMEKPQFPAVARENISQELTLAQDLNHQESAEHRDLSSLSDKSLDQYTKLVLLGKGDETAWERMPPPPAARRSHYTLSDLKRLSQLAELDAAGVSVGEDRSQPQSGWQRVQGPHQAMTSRNEHQEPQNTYKEPLEPFVRPPALHLDDNVHSDDSNAIRNNQERLRARPLRQDVTKDRPGISQLLRDGLPLHNLHLSADRISWLLGTDSAVPNNGSRRHVAPSNDGRSKPGNDPGVPLWQHPTKYAADPYYDNIAIDTQVHAVQDPLMFQILSTQPRPVNADTALEMHDFENQPNDLGQINALWWTDQQPADIHDEFDRSLMREGAQQHQHDPSAHLLDHALIYASYDNTLGRAENAMYIDNKSFEPHQDNEYLGGEPADGENRGQSIQEKQPKSGHWLRKGQNLEQMHPGSGHWLREGQSHADVFGQGALESEEVFSGFTRPHVLY